MKCLIKAKNQNALALKEWKAQKGVVQLKYEGVKQAQEQQKEAIFKLADLKVTLDVCKEAVSSFEQKADTERLGGSSGVSTSFTDPDLDFTDPDLDSLMANFAPPATQHIGDCNGHVAIIEFQKRGAPHCHILTWMKNFEMSVA